MLFKYHFSDLYYAHKVDDPAEYSPSYRDHFHTEYEMVFFMSGKAEFLIENKRYPLRPGQLMLIQPGSHHNIHLLGTDRYERYVVRFSEYLIPSPLMEVMHRTEGCFDVSGSVIPDLFPRFDEHAKRIGEDEQTIKQLFRCVFTEILIYLCRISKKEGVSVNLLKTDMALVLDYINSHLNEPLGLDDICAHFHYSKSYLCREFSKSIGVSVLSYIHAKKITYADALIRSGMKVYEVSDFLGFSNYSTFFRIYKKITGRSPTKK